MKLARLSYAEFAGTANEWRVDKCLLGDVNLLVGMNASGKSRTLNVIKALADLVCGDDKLHFLSGDYEALFDDGGRTVQYSLKYDDLQVVREVLKVDGADRITRGPSGEGRIHAERVGEPIDFRVPLEALACVSKRDALQHPFLEPLYQWGKCMRHYPFGSPLGKDSFIIPAPGRLTTELNLKDPNCVVALFRKASPASAVGTILTAF